MGRGPQLVPVLSTWLAPLDLRFSRRLHAHSKPYARGCLDARLGVYGDDGGGPPAARPVARAEEQVQLRPDDEERVLHVLHHLHASTGARWSVGTVQSVFSEVPGSLQVSYRKPLYRKYKSTSITSTQYYPFYSGL